MKKKMRAMQRKQRRSARDALMNAGGSIASTGLRPAVPAPYALDHESWRLITAARLSLAHERLGDLALFARENARRLLLYFLFLAQLHLVALGA